MVVAVTISTTWKRITLHTGRRGSSLGDVLFRDGIKYFVVLLSLNMTQVILTLLSIKPGSRGESYIPILSEPLTAIFISRFLLDLQSANQASRKLGSRTLESLPNLPSSDETPTFAARIIGSIGASTGPDFAYLEEEEEPRSSFSPRATQDPGPAGYDSSVNGGDYLGASPPPRPFSASEVTITETMSQASPFGAGTVDSV
ncbi:hypothetical protein C8Q79DRAFT_369290 [Trametes meyenii]|nr:hypothetical protein C8Q79DRAFT_369290 [Trametes meyenii]